MSSRKLFRASSVGGKAGVLLEVSTEGAWSSKRDWNSGLVGLGVGRPTELHEF